MRHQTARTPCMRLDSERGTAFMEFIVCVPFLLVIGLGITGLGQSLVTYLSLYRIAYEGSRYAAATASLEYGEFKVDADAVSSPAQQLVRQRIVLLLQMNGLGPELANGDIGIFTARYKPADITPPPVAGTCYSQDQVTVGLSLHLTNFYSFDPGRYTLGTGGTQLRATVNGPYLFQVDPAISPPVCN